MSETDHWGHFVYLEDFEEDVNINIDIDRDCQILGNNRDPRKAHFKYVTALILCCICLVSLNIYFI